MNMLQKLLVPVVAVGLGVSIIGCAIDRHSAVPANAQLVNRTTDRGDWTAPSDGMVYIDMENSRDLLYSGQVRKGQTISVNERDNRISIDGRAVVDQRVPRGTYRIWFRDEGERTIERRTVEETREVQIRTNRN
jgi:hypothetical protein